MNDEVVFAEYYRFDAKFVMSSDMMRFMNTACCLFRDNRGNAELEIRRNL
jgi:hypothetical protein